jgi:hypothetical protein
MARRAGARRYYFRAEDAKDVEDTEDVETAKSKKADQDLFVPDPPLSA